MQIIGGRKGYEKTSARTREQPSQETGVAKSSGVDSVLYTCSWGSPCRQCSVFGGVVGYSVTLWLFLVCFCVKVSLGQYETSWHFYNEEPCCMYDKHWKPQKDLISEFSCGRQHYGPLLALEKEGLLFAGGMDYIYRLNLSDISQGNCEKDAMYLEATDVAECIISGKSEEYECRNHIEIIEDLGGDLLYICGTNAYNPRDLVIYKNLRHLPRHIHYKNVGRALGRCSRGPNSHSASLLVSKRPQQQSTNLQPTPADESATFPQTSRDSVSIDRGESIFKAFKNTPEVVPSKLSSPVIAKTSLKNDGNLNHQSFPIPHENGVPASEDHGESIELPSDLPALFAATRADSLETDALISRWDLRNSSTADDIPLYLRTIKYDTKWLDGPEFVSMHQLGEHVYTLFREHSACSTGKLARAARVCAGDRGAARARRHWATFTKAAISCSTPHRDRIESSYKTEDDTIHIAFTSFRGSPMPGSAICSFSAQAFGAPFSGAFASPRGPVTETPDPRPGTCVEDTVRLSDNVVNFARSHPMMLGAILPDIQRPIYVQKDAIFSAIVVDRTSGMGDTRYSVYYAGTNNGYIYKIIHWMSLNESHSFLQDVWKVLPNEEPVTSLSLSRTTLSLFVVSRDRIKQVYFRGVCKHQYDSCVRCSRDPYCGWSDKEDRCLPYTKDLFQDVQDSSPRGCDLFIQPKRVSTTFGQSVHLGSFISLPGVVKEFDYTWTKFIRETGKNEPIHRSNKYILTANHGLVVMGLTQKDAGRFECRLGKRLVAVYELTVESNRCSQPAQNGTYHRVYLDWCREFVKHKVAMQNWYSKRKQCHKLDWSERRSNEVLPGF